jgi:dTDP-4-dehydrorhamnose 3,5-epimerase
MDIQGLFLVERKLIKDDRGSFYRAFCDKELEPILNGRKIKQINVSKTLNTGAIRGFHFQEPPNAEMKLIRCLFGKVWDVAVDLRNGSPTFLQWHAEELSAENGRMYIISEGFAHGFQVLEKESQLLYLHTASYEPKSERGIRYNDPMISVKWPIVVTNISSKDSNYPLITKEFMGVIL